MKTSLMKKLNKHFEPMGGGGGEREREEMMLRRGGLRIWVGKIEKDRQCILINEKKKF